MKKIPGGIEDKNKAPSRGMWAVSKAIGPCHSCCSNALRTECLPVHDTLGYSNAYTASNRPAQFSDAANIMK